MWSVSARGALWGYTLRLGAAVALCALIGALVTSASAQADHGGSDVDAYALAIAPASVPAGSTTTFTVRLTNDPNNAEALNGAELRTPAGFVLLSGSLAPGTAGSVTVSGDTLLLSGLNGKPGRPVTLTVTARVPSRCGRFTRTWGSSAWEDDAGFPNGREQLAFHAAASAVGTTVQSPCQLAYGLAVTPTTVAAGHAVSLHLTLANRSSSGVRLSGATIAIPRALRALRASLTAGESGRLRVGRRALHVDGIALGAGRTLSLRVQAIAPLRCGTAAYLWGGVASSASRRLALETADRQRTTLARTLCALRFRVQPRDSLVGSHITGAEFDPSGPPLAVDVVAAGRVVTSADTEVKLTLAANPGDSSLEGDTSVTAIHGIARFSTLTLGKPADGYALSAASLDGATRSASFNEADAGSQCIQNVTCQTTLKSATGTLQIIATPDKALSNAGSLRESVDEGAPLECAGYSPIDPNWYVFAMTSSNRSKQVSYTISEPYPSSGIPRPIEETAKFCYAASYQFTTSAGTPATAGTLPDGSSGYIGLLPTCPASGPCVEPALSLPSGWDSFCSLWNGLLWTQLCGTMTLKVDIPDGLPGDPWGRA